MKSQRGRQSRDLREAGKRQGTAMVVVGLRLEEKRLERRARWRPKKREEDFENNFKTMFGLKIFRQIFPNINLGFYQNKKRKGSGLFKPHDEFAKTK